MKNRDPNSQNSQKEISNALMKVKFESYDSPVNVYGLRCADTECKCRDIYLDFYEGDKKRAKDHLFEIQLNVDTWEITSFTAYKKDINCLGLISEFMQDFNDESKRKLKSVVENRIIFNKETLIENIDYSRLQQGLVVYYSDFFASEHGGQLIFEYQGDIYIVIDYYCSKPTCNCNDVMLSFVKVKNNECTSDSEFQLRLQFKTGKYEVENKLNNITNAQITSLYKAFLNALQPNGLGLFEERYDRLRNWKNGMPDITVNAYKQQNESGSQKIGRNEPCPCGSGKKYKKCCGQ